MLDVVWESAPAWLIGAVVAVLLTALLTGTFTVVLRRRMSAEARALQLRNAELEREVRARVQAEAERARLAARLGEAQRLESVGTLAAGVAHEFNNLLAVILGNTALAARLAGPNDDLQGLLGEVTEGAKRGAKITGALLAFARCGDAGHAPCAAADLLAQAVQLVRAAAPAGVTVRADVPDDPRLVMNANAEQLAQAVVNLGMNALDAVAPDGKVVLSARYDDAARPEVVISVTDDGPGVPAELRERVFEPFFTTKSRAMSAGLGLALVHGVAGAHDGRVRAGSGPDGGACFTLRLPACPLPEAEDGRVPDPTVPAAFGRVLVADDNSDLRAVMARALAGFGVTMAADGGAAWNLYQSEPQGWAAVVVAMDLPGIPSHPLIAQMRSRRADLPVVAVSAHPGPLEFCAAGPAVEVIAKPFDADQLRAAVATAIVQSA